MVNELRESTTPGEGLKLADKNSGFPYTLQAEFRQFLDKKT